MWFRRRKLKGKRGRRVVPYHYKIRSWLFPLIFFPEVFESYTGGLGVPAVIPFTKKQKKQTKRGLFILTAFFLFYCCSADSLHTPVHTHSLPLAPRGQSAAYLRVWGADPRPVLFSCVVAGPRVGALLNTHPHSHTATHTRIPRRATEEPREMFQGAGGPRKGGRTRSVAHPAPRRPPPLWAPSPRARSPSPASSSPLGVREWHTEQTGTRPALGSAAAPRRRDASVGPGGARRRRRRLGRPPHARLPPSRAPRRRGPPSPASPSPPALLGSAAVAASGP